MDLKPGQKVYVKRMGNEARYKGEYYTEETVEKVGRKWFTIEKFWREKFNLETGLNYSGQYSSTMVVYESIQKIEEEKEIKDKCRKIADAFNFGMNIKNLTIDKIRLIYGAVYDCGEL